MSELRPQLQISQLRDALRVWEVIEESFTPTLRKMNWTIDLKSSYFPVFTANIAGVEVSLYQGGVGWTWLVRLDGRAGLATVGVPMEELGTTICYELSGYLEHQSEVKLRCVTDLREEAAQSLRQTPDGGKDG